MRPYIFAILITQTEYVETYDIVSFATMQGNYCCVTSGFARFEVDVTGNLSVYGCTY